MLVLIYEDIFQELCRQIDDLIHNNGITFIYRYSLFSEFRENVRVISIFHNVFNNFFLFINSTIFYSLLILF